MTGRRVATAAVAAAAVVGLVSAPAGATRQRMAVNPLVAGHAYRHGVVPMRGSAHAYASAALDSPSNLSYGGSINGVGVTTGKEKVYLVFWGSQWGTQGTNGSGDATFSGDPGGMAPYLQEFFKGLGTGGETWSGVMTQYCEGVATGAQDCTSGAAHVAYPTGGALAGVWEDKSAAAPAQADGNQIGTAALAAAHHFGNTTQASNRDTQYVVVSPTGTDPDSYEQQGFCAWHDYSGDTTLTGGAVSSDVGQFAFTNLPYILDAGAGCGQDFVNPTGTLDGVSIVEGHEYAETITDQFPAGGWTDSQGAENGDKCAWITAGNPGAAQDITLTTGTFAVQTTWANDANSGTGGCEVSHSIVTGPNEVTVTNPGGQSGTVGQSVHLQIQASDSDTTQTLTYGATGLPAGLSIAPSTGLISGTLTTPVSASVTVTANDTTTAHGNATFSWHVTQPNVVTVNSPGAQATTLESGVRLQIHANDSGTGQTLTYSATGLPVGLSISASTGVIKGTVSKTSISTVTVKAVDGTGAHGSATFPWSVVASKGIRNGGFELGTLAGWTRSGAHVVDSRLVPHSGRYDALLGLATPTKGSSSIAQSFTAPTGTSVLSLWYDVTCPDVVSRDWATVTLVDHTAGTTTTILPHTCVASSGWVEVTAAVMVGHAYTLTITSHDDDRAGNATFTRVDDVTLGP